MIPKRIIFSLGALAGSLALISTAAEAHCPLCTAGAALAVGGAAWLGVSKVILGLFVGAFGASTGMWMARTIKKKYFKLQDITITIASFLLTVIPISPMISKYYSYYVSLAGGYGTLLNRTYMIDLSLLTAIVGGIIVAIAPIISKRITDARGGKHIPYQGILITFGILIVVGFLLQTLAWIL